MRTLVLSLLCISMFSLDSNTGFSQDCAGLTSVQASCGGSATLRTPIRNLLAVRPIRSAGLGILQKISSVRATGCGSGAAMQASCAGSAAVQSSCAGSMSVPMAPAPQAACSDCSAASQSVPLAACSCGCQQGGPCNCNSQAAANCSIGESQQYFQVSAAVPQGRFVSAGDEAYQRAFASASYRAQNSIKGHVSGELAPGRASSAGVGYSSFNPNPLTCLGVPGRTNATCAVVRGVDGWYSTCVK